MGCERQSAAPDSERASERASEPAPEVASAPESGSARVPAGAIADQGEPAKLIEGGALAPADLRGQWVFVNYWAEWCRPCLVEIPELNAFDAEHDEVRVLGVNFDRVPPEEARAQARKLDIRFAVFAGAAPDWLPVRQPEVLPSTYVMNPRGERVAVLRGPQTTETLREVMRPPASEASAEDGGAGQ